MQELGKKSDIFGVEKLVSLRVNGNPTKMPVLEKDEKLICGYDQGLGERIFVCDNLEDMQTLYDSYAKGGALRIHWYKGADPGFITIISGS